MSLTSYRAAPPRAKSWPAGSPRAARGAAGRGWPGSMKRACVSRAFFRFGGDLLSRVLGRSTIGAAVLNGRVRDGIGCFTRARTTKPGKPTTGGRVCGAGGDTRDCLSVDTLGFRLPSGTGLPSSGSDEAYRAISTGQLNALLRLYLRPIDVVVFHGPQGRPGFEGGFPLRCLQRLSCPHIATLHCRWHDNRSTSGAFTPVLSY